MTKPVKLTDEAYECGKSAMLPGETWSTFIIRVSEANCTNNNAPPKPVPAPVQEPDPLKLTFVTQNDAIKEAKRLNTRLGFIKYFVRNPSDDDEPCFRLSCHPTTPEEKEAYYLKNHPTNGMSWKDYMKSLRDMHRSDCASH